jgi:hypothetical protein
MAISGFPSSRQPMAYLHLKRWQLALLGLTVTTIALILLAVFIIPTIEISVRRVAPAGDIAFVSISSQIVQDNKGLQEAISCADNRYEILKNSPGYSMPVDDVCYVKISWFDFKMFEDTTQLSQLTHRYDTIYDEKYYLITRH